MKGFDVKPFSEIKSHIEPHLSEEEIFDLESIYKKWTPHQCAKKWDQFELGPAYRCIAGDGAFRINADVGGKENKITFVEIETPDQFSHIWWGNSSGWCTVKWRSKHKISPHILDFTWERLDTDNPQKTLKIIPHTEEKVWFINRYKPSDFLLEYPLSPEQKKYLLQWWI